MGTTHMAEISRRERKRLHLCARIRGDITLTSIWALWQKTPVGVLPSASSPAAMWQAFPEYEKEVAELPSKAHLPTLGPDGPRWRRWKIGHMWHCARCRAYSRRKMGAGLP